MEQLLPSPAVGPAHPAARKGGWARMVLGYSPGRAELFSQYFRRGRNAMYILEHDDVKLVDLAEGLTKALCTGFCEYGGFSPERLSWEIRWIAACRVSRR